MPSYSSVQLLAPHRCHCILCEELKIKTADIATAYADEAVIRARIANLRYVGNINEKDSQREILYGLKADAWHRIRMAKKARLEALMLSLEWHWQNG